MSRTKKIVYKTCKYKNKDSSIKSRNLAQRSFPQCQSKYDLVLMYIVYFYDFRKHPILTISQQFAF